MSLLWHCFVIVFLDCNFWAMYVFCPFFEDFCCANWHEEFDPVLVVEQNYKAKSLALKKEI